MVTLLRISFAAIRDWRTRGIAIADRGWRAVRGRKDHHHPSMNLVTEALPAGVVVVG